MICRASWVSPLPPRETDPATVVVIYAYVRFSEVSRASDLCYGHYRSRSREGRGISIVPEIEFRPETETRPEPEIQVSVSAICETVTVRKVWEPLDHPSLTPLVSM